MAKTLAWRTAFAALLICAALPAMAADVKPVINDAGKLRPVHAGETVGVANGGTGAGTAAAARTALGVQASDAELDALAGVTSAADKVPYFTGSGTASTATFTAAGRALVDDADATAQRATLGAQASDAELDALAGVTSAADKVPYFTGSGTASTATFTAAGRALVDDADAAAQRATLGAQASDAELDALAGVTSAADKVPYFTGSGTASTATFTAAGRALVDDADATAQRATLGLGTFATQDYASPPPIGATAPAAGKFSTLQATGGITTSVTGSTQCLHVDSAGLVSGTGADCGAGSGTVTTTGSPASGNLAKFSGASSVTSGDLSGDCTTSGALAITCTKTGGVNLGTFATQNYATPPAIGGTTPAAGAFSTLSATGNLTTNVTGSTQCLQANTSGVVSGTGSACGAGGGGGSSAAGPVFTGRLTLTSGSPVMGSGVTAASTLYYSRYSGNTVPIYDGSATQYLTYTEPTLILDTTNHKSLYAYDVFAYSSGGTVTLGAGPAWNYSATVTMTIAAPGVISWTAHGLREGDAVVFTTTGALPTGITAGTTYVVCKTANTNDFRVATSYANAAAGTCVTTSGSQSGTHTATAVARTRGTGAGTSELEWIGPARVNKYSITLYNNSASTVVAADRATYLGTVLMSANGQTSQTVRVSGAGGGGGWLGVFNAYNQIYFRSESLETTGSWTYASTTPRPSNNSIANRITWIDGLGMTPASTFMQIATWGAAGGGGAVTLIDCNSSDQSNTSTARVGQDSSGYVNAGGVGQCPIRTGFNYAQSTEAIGLAVSRTFAAMSMAIALPY